MGRASRLHREAVIAGKEQPYWTPDIPYKLFRCKKCGDHMGEVNVRDHIRKCWNHPIKDDEPIPTSPIVISRSRPESKKIVLEVDD